MSSIVRSQVAHQANGGSKLARTTKRAVTSSNAVYTVQFVNEKTLQQNCGLFGGVTSSSIVGNDKGSFSSAVAFNPNCPGNQTYPWSGTGKPPTVGVFVSYDIALSEGSVTAGGQWSTNFAAGGVDPGNLYNVSRDGSGNVLFSGSPNSGQPNDVVLVFDNDAEFNNMAIAFMINGSPAIAHDNKLQLAGYTITFTPKPVYYLACGSNVMENNLVAYQAVSSFQKVDFTNNATQLWVFTPVGTWQGPYGPVSLESAAYPYRITTRQITETIEEFH